MKKKLIALLLAVALIASFTVAASAATARYGTFKDNKGNIYFWAFDPVTKVLTIRLISGTGELVLAGDAPWNGLGGEADRVILSGDISDIPAGAFDGFSAMKSVVLPESVVSVDSAAFTGCDSLAKVECEGNPETMATIIQKSGSPELAGATVTEISSEKAAAEVEQTEEAAKKQALAGNGAGYETGEPGSGEGDPGSGEGDPGDSIVSVQPFEYTEDDGYTSKGTKTTYASGKVVFDYEDTDPDGNVYAGTETQFPDGSGTNVYKAYYADGRESNGVINNEPNDDGSYFIAGSEVFQDGTVEEYFGQADKDYNMISDVLTTKAPDGTLLNTTRTYYENGQISSAFETEYSYDDNGNPVTVSTTEYDAALEVVQTQVTDMVYDENGLMVQATITHYSGDGKIIDSGVSDYVYDNNGTQLRIETTYYDAEGKVSGSSIIENGYDADGNQINQQTTEYDTNGLATSSRVLNLVDFSITNITYNYYGQGKYRTCEYTVSDAGGNVVEEGTRKEYLNQEGEWEVTNEDIPNSPDQNSLM